MYQFKTNLLENGEDHKTFTLRKLMGRLSGFRFGSGGIVNDSGHRISIKDGYMHLFHNDKHTGVYDAETSSFVQKVRDYFRK